MSDTNNPFLEEAYELIAELENALLELEENPDDMDLIGRVFRAMHTIKGSGAMFGYENIAEFTHELETAFDLVGYDGPCKPFPVGTGPDKGHAGCFGER